MAVRCSIFQVSNWCAKINRRQICRDVSSKRKFKCFSSPAANSRSLHTSAVAFQEESFIVTVVLTDGTKHQVRAKKGETVLDCVKNNSFLDIMGYGVCDGGASCSTCHVTFKEEDFERLQPKEDIESDLLELMGTHPETSRLGCQVRLAPEMAGIEIHIPTFRQDVREAETNYSSV